MRFTCDFPFVFAAFCRAHPSLSLYFARNFGINRRQIPSVSRMPSFAKPAQSRPLPQSHNYSTQSGTASSAQTTFFAFFLSRVHSCTIRLISLFPMTKNARYGRINFRGRLAQRERRCLTSIGSGVQIPHRPPFERTMAARLSSHFLFPHYSNCDINSTSTHSLASPCTTICTTNRTTPRTSTAFLLPFFRYHCPKLTPKEASHAKCQTKARTRS